jgi:aquaporin TIP
MPVRLGSALIAEFIGTFALCFVGICAINQAGSVPGGGGLLLVAVAHGLILSIMVTAAMPTSGGHFNPAVTLSFLVTRKIKPGAAAAYIVTQLAAGIVAALAVMAIYHNHDPRGAEVVLAGTPDVGPGFNGGAALLTEIVLTFFLVFAVWGTAADPRARNVGGFGIGLTVAADILAGGPITGASMNPARSFGPALIGSMAQGGSRIWHYHWIYWVGPIAGGLLAGVIYHLFLWPRDEDRGIDPGAVDVPDTQRPI